MTDSAKRMSDITGFTPTVVRLFGWAMIACLAAFLINNYLTMSLRWPGIAPIFFDSEAASQQSWIQAALLAGLVLIGLVFAWRTPHRGLRVDSLLISNIAAYLIRAAFYGVLFVGLVDAAISFLMVENMLVDIFGSDMAKELVRPRDRGPMVHIPILFASALLALFNRSLGFIWLTLLVVAAELLIVFSRFVFSYEQAFMGDLVRFWYAALFLFASANTLLVDGHVRVDVFYAGFKSRTKGLVNAVGSILMGMSFCWIILFTGMGNRAAIINGPMLNYEISQSGFGMYTKYLMAGFLGVFAITMLIQFVSALFESIADYRNEPGGLDPDSSPAQLA